MGERATSLREKAKQELQSKGEIDLSLFGNDLKTIIEELSIYQIELEQQNQQLIESQEKILQINDKYIDLFQNAPIGYIIINSDNIISNINKTACQLLCGDNELVMGSKFTLFVHPDDQDKYYWYFRSLISKTSKDHCDIKLLSKNQRNYFFARITGNHQLHSKDQDPEFRLAIIDISHEKEMELNLIKAKEKAEENDKLKSVFLANMSHEIRTPMNGIIGFTDLLKDPDITAESRKSYIEIIEKSGNLLLDLINELIDISKIEAGQMQVNLTPTKISDLLLELKQFFLPEATAKNLHLSFENHLKDCDYYIETDKDKLFAILVNLIKNSIKYTKQGSIRFGVYNAGSQLKFYVKDSGIGIPKEKLHIIFQRFRQVEETAFHEGTGLGLSIVKGMVELLGGKVGFTSEFGKGSLFYFTIPDQTGIPNDISESIDLGIIPMLKNYTIIVAEDDIFSSILLEELLKRSNATTYFASNGVQLMNLLQDITPDLILLDINMPVKNGYECLKEIKEQGIQTKIIAVTAFALNEEKEMILGLGCNGYITKPYKKENLYKEIERLIYK